MKILYVTTISNTVNAFLIPHIQMLIDEGHQVDIACNEEQPFKSELIKLGVSFFQIPFSRSPINYTNVTAFKELRKIILEEKYDIVHTHTPVASMISRMVCKKQKNIRVIYTAHGFHFFKGAPLKNWLLYYPLEKYLSRYTHDLITMNNEDYELVNKKFTKPESIKTPGIGVNLERFFPYLEDEKKQLRLKQGFSEYDFILTYVGELSDRKNQNQLIDVIEKLKSKIPRLKLLLVGIGPKETELKLKVKNHNLTKEIFFLGYRTDVVDIMNISDIIVSTSKQEGLPVNLLEGLSVGKPIIATNSRGNSDLVIEGYNGLLSQINDSKTMSENILYLYNQPELRKNMGENSLIESQKYEITNVLDIERTIYFK